MSRRLGREKALQTLFQCDVGNADADEALKYLVERGEVQEKAAVFADTLVKGTIENLDLIDSYIRKYSQGWKIERLAAIERNVLRIAIYEVLFCEDIPEKVTINEAIELVRLFSSDDSVGFVNGILDAIVKEREKESAARVEYR